MIAQFPNQVIPARLVQRWLNSKGAPPPPPAGETWEENRPTRWARPAGQAWAEEEEEGETPTWETTDIEISSAVRRNEPSHLDSISVDGISFVTGMGLSQTPSVITGESMIGFQWVVAPGAFRTQ